MTLQINELDILQKKVDELLALAHGRLAKKWYTAKEAWELKGGMAYTSYKQDRFYKPLGGCATRRINNNPVYSAEEIAEWLPLTDEELPAYHARHKTGARRKGSPNEY